MRSKLAQAIHSLLTYALSKHLESVDYLGIVATEHARSNRKHPEYAKLEIRFPDSWLVNAVGNEKFADTYFIVKINREVTDEWSEMCRVLRQKREAESQNPPEDTGQPLPSSEEHSPATTDHSFLISDNTVND